MAFLLSFSSLSTPTAHNSDFFFLLQSNLFLLIKYVEHGDAGDHLIEQLPQSFDKRFDSNSVLTNVFFFSIYHCSGVWPREITIDTVTKKVFAITIKYSLCFLVSLPILVFLSLFLPFCSVYSI